MLKVWTNWRFGNTKLARGEDVKEALETSLKSAQMALELNPKDWQPNYFYSLVLSILADLSGTLEKDQIALKNQSIIVLR